jgi:hypothetical protein
VLACQDIVDDEETFKHLDDAQRRHLKATRERSARDLKEAVWRTYRYVLLLDRDNTLKVTELTQPNSSMANSLAELIVNRLRADDEIADGVGTHGLVRYWPPTLAAWSMKAARDAFYSSPGATTSTARATPARTSHGRPRAGGPTRRAGTSPRAPGPTWSAP